MKATVSIGRSPENDVVINQPDISSHHATITTLEDNEFMVEDLDSSNGVYVNGYRIKSSKVSLADQVRLSANHIIDLEVIFGLKEGSVLQIPEEQDKKTNDKDFTDEFLHLEKVYNDYRKDKNRIVQGNQRKQVIIRMGFMALPLAIQAVTKEIALSGSTILLGGLAQLIPGGNKHLDKLEELNDNFMVRFVCPNKSCNQILSGRSWAVWHNTGECPKCKAIFNKNKL
ncbi:FHA domain-containing protein [Chryseobacterium kwangjuense]|uniref:FHA domain-containing protein n=1 Tax=Chryseobacterium kwangjuense TaxID=267125 RepID=A0A135WDL7_9FLAO|nr:FHA domain-containing protein [Chryseobacterium kwangjuense]KXH82977.1 hypothetical protein AU378_11105 [Chryseobacterium kwangjuense]